MILLKKLTILKLSVNVTFKGFQMAKKSEGLRKEEMESTLVKLAKFHAASAVYYEERGPFHERFSRGLYNADMQEIFGAQYDFNFTFVIEEFVNGWPNLDKRIVDKMVKINKHTLTRQFKL